MRLPLAFASGGQRHAAIVLGVPPPSDPRRQLCDDWSAAFISQEHEFDAVPLHAAVGGSLPLTLRGTLFKNGPARFSRGDERYAHWLDGDGYVTSLVLDGRGGATWSGRFVRTEAYGAEEAAGRVLYRTTFGTQKAGGTAANAFDIRLKSPANTNVIATAGGSLLALWEVGGRP